MVEDKTFWRIIKWMCVVQVISAGMDYLVWFGNGLRIPWDGGVIIVTISNYIPAWVLATLSLAYVAIIMGVIKK